MSDFSDKRPAAKWEPGTLDKTRKNIGPIDEAEAKAMMKKLGGEIFTEKSVPINPDTMPKNKTIQRRPLANNKKTTEPSSSKKMGFSVDKPSSTSNSRQSLPDISSKEKQLMDKLMMSPDYHIKHNYGFFNFVLKFRKNGQELVRSGWIANELSINADHYNLFITSVKSLISVCPDTYVDKIDNSNEDRFRLLRLINTWKENELKGLISDIEDDEDNVTIADLIPVTKILYKNLLKVYYLGESRIPALFKEVFNDLMIYPKADKKKLMMLSKSCMTEWIYLYSNVVRGMYPLLMRMSCTHYETFPQIFITETQSIFKFLEITKFDVLLPYKGPDKEEQASESQDEEPKEEKKTQEELDAEKKEREERMNQAELIKTGKRILDQLFPDAGFNKIETLPDMYPYFQPLYQFRDGFNSLAINNPLQITITLMRILEDFFHGLRNITFTEEEEGLQGFAKDKLSTVFNEWSLYREILFEKNYCEQLKNLVNQQYSSSDFKTSLFGKKLITSLLWQTKYNFLPHFEFTQLLLEKPQNDSPYRPLCIRVEFLYSLFSSLVKRIDVAAKTKNDVMGVQNPWEKYKFDLPNVVSRRLDVLLGAKKPVDKTAATNANLIKYTLCIIAVLNWWINDKSSPAYGTNPSDIYRTNPEDGSLAFSADLRSDQNRLFTESIKAAIERQAAKKAASTQS